MLCFVFLFSFSPCAQCYRKHREKTLTAFLQAAANIVRRRIAEEQEKNILTFSFNSVNFETLSDSCFKVSSIRIHLPLCCFSQGTRLRSKDVSTSCSPGTVESQGLGPLLLFREAGTCFWPSYLPQDWSSAWAGRALSGHWRGKVEISGSMLQKEGIHLALANSSFWGPHSCIPKSCIAVRGLLATSNKMQSNWFK